VFFTIYREISIDHGVIRVLEEVYFNNSVASQYALPSICRHFVAISACSKSLVSFLVVGEVIGRHIY
jgi:hypothetical protein